MASTARVGGCSSLQICQMLRRTDQDLYAHILMSSVHDDQAGGAGTSAS